MCMVQSRNWIQYIDFNRPGSDYSKQTGLHDLSQNFGFLLVKMFDLPGKLVLTYDHLERESS